MPLSAYAAAFPGFIQTLTALDAILDKAVEQAEARKIAPEVLLGSRLAPDMLPFSRQIQLACDFVKNSAARVSGAENPRKPDEEKTFAELKARIAWTLAFAEGIDKAALDAGLAKDVTFPRGKGEAVMKGEVYLTRFALPNFYFHAATAYAILRENGIQVGKMDFLGDVFEA
ncbi:DUF1993 domain-containing protein [Bosea caraganae]|uniref:DUF1993 domain-containing protein n=1 Tax=Bosea caraganae TaxID=2763117 RepID=A0A370L7U0_9HYPH|nr:DUF1993 domain-containing protein [Bosea caraganae]RDJ24997.1 DUF1993 domain-containing protein [Bosea caraganae]RDJ26107.1 DUF1993 domain-containing protein [Bosea caraganae]